MAYKSKELDVQSYSYMYTCLMIKTMLLASLEATIASPFIYVGALKKGWEEGRAERTFVRRCDGCGEKNQLLIA